MNKYLLISLVVLTQICLIFLYINKETNIIKLTYNNQKLEKILNNLIEKKLELNNNILYLQNPNIIKDFAINKLGMQKTKLNQIKILEK